MPPCSSRWMSFNLTDGVSVLQILLLIPLSASYSGHRDGVTVRSSNAHMQQGEPPSNPPAASSSVRWNKPLCDRGICHSSNREACRLMDGRSGARDNKIWNWGIWNLARSEAAAPSIVSVLYISYRSKEGNPLISKSFVPHPLLQRKLSTNSIGLLDQKP